VLRPSVSIKRRMNWLLTSRGEYSHCISRRYDDVILVTSVAHLHCCQRRCTQWRRFFSLEPSRLVLGRLFSLRPSDSLRALDITPDESSPTALVDFPLSKPCVVETGRLATPICLLFRALKCRPEKRYRLGYAVFFARLIKTAADNSLPCAFS